MTTVSIRASDAEREQVTGVLQRAVAEGRLTPEEGGERLAAASAARYREELGQLVRDLPATVDPMPHAPRRLPWLWMAARLVRGLVLGALFATLLFWGIGLFLPFWIFGLVVLTIMMGGRRRRYRAMRWRGWGWHGSPGRYRPSSLPW
ncbi:MAG TPA: DUF1707 domain-containing protein [Gemmatimonadales bacterium]